MKLYFDDRYVGAAHGFDTTRKAGLVAEAAASMPDVTLVSPKEATQREIALVHDPAYVRAVLTGDGPRRSSAGFGWDEGYAKGVAASTGGIIEAALTALKEGVSGSLSSGLHHASRESGSGFCTFNGLALAAKIALGDRPKGQWPRRVFKKKCKKVLILDLDAHCGGGTYDIIKDDSRIWQIDISVCHFDGYKADSERHHLHVVRDPSDYLSLLEIELERAAEVGFDLVIYNSGMDPHEDCGIGGLRGITSDIIRLRERMVFNWALANNIPIAFALAGGYTGMDMWEARLTALHQMTIVAATQGRMPDMAAIEANPPIRIIPKKKSGSGSGGMLFSVRNGRIEFEEDEEDLPRFNRQNRSRWNDLDLDEQVHQELAEELNLVWEIKDDDDEMSGDDYQGETGVREYKSIHELPQSFFEMDNEELRQQYPEFFQ